MDAPKLIADLEDAQKRYEAIVREIGEGQPTDAQQEEMDRLHAHALRTKNLIVEAQSVARDKDFKELTDFLEKPQYRVPRGVVEDDEGRKMLSRIGWDCKNGIVVAGTSTGKTVEMFGEDVLFGPIPENDEAAAKYFRTTRAAMHPDYRSAWMKYLRLATRFQNEVTALQQLTPSEQKALSEGTDTAGGYLVPPDLQAEILVRTAQQSAMRRLARIVTTSRDKIVYPRVQSASATASGLSSGGGSVFSSAFIGGWVGETPSASDTDAVLGQFEINVRKLRISTRLSNDLLSDSALNIASFLAQNGAENMALVEDQGFISGDGTALQPLGILNGGASTVDVEDAGASNTFSNVSGGSGTGSAAKMINLAYTLPAQYADGASWLMRRSTEGKARQFADTTGRFLWPEQAGSLLGSVNRTLLGYPIINSDFMPADGADTNKVLIFGNFNGYIIAQRAQISTRVLSERYADTDQTGIVIFERVGGGLWNTDAIRYGVV